jgi:hypothetical protein
MKKFKVFLFLLLLTLLKDILGNISLEYFVIKFSRKK